MAWETRNGMGRYYTRSFRVNDRVVREYVGAGPAGELAARQDQREREQRQIEREAQLEERERLEAITQVLRTLARLSKVSMKEVLEGAGYHCHKGQWRKQRISEVKAMSEKQAVSQQRQVDPEATKEILEAVRERRPGSLIAFDKVIKEIPELLTVCGDMTYLAEKKLLSLTAGDDALALEMRRSWLEDIRQKLAEPGDGELDRHLIHRVSLNLLAVSYAEARRAERWRANASEHELDSWDRRVSRYQTDLFKASRALRKARRLARPTVLAQMNIAENQQINISAASQPIEAADAE